MAAATSNEMKSYRFRTFTGPVDVNVVADRLRDAGIDAHAGTEHVYGSIRASNRVAAIDRINEAARFQLVSWNDLHLKDGISEPAGSASEGDPSAMGDVIPPRPTAREAAADPVRTEIVDSMARTLFVEAWANREEEMGHRLRGELMSQAPPTPRAAHHQASALARDIEKLNGQSLEALYTEAAAVPGKHYREPTPRDFGYGLVMQALGSGVSWYDDHPHGSHPIKLPRIESLDLDRQANETAEEIAVSRSVRWDLQNGMYRGVGRRGTYVVIPAYREGQKGGGWLAMKGDEELGWGARAEHAIDIADTYDLEGKRSKYWRDVPPKVEMHAHEAGPGGALDWKQGADGSWASPAPTGGASYVISPDDKGSGLTVWYMPHHGQAAIVSHNQSLGAAMMAASRDVNDKAGYQSAAEEHVPVVHERGSEEPRRVEPGDQPHHHFHVTDEQHTVHVSPDGKVKPVKNLGWLLKHWKEVERFEVMPWGLQQVGGKPHRPGKHHWDALMIAYLRDGGRYEALWADRSVMRDWLHRPVFRGVPVKWFGEQTAAENVREDFRTKEGAERFAASMGATHITDNGKECHLYFPHDGHYVRRTLFRKEENWHIGRRKEKVKKLPGDAKSIAKESVSEEAPRDIPFDEIKPGDRVTLLTPQKQEHTGRAVMRGPAGWVLNMGGPHGTPGVATPENFVRARRVAREEADEDIHAVGDRIQWRKLKDGNLVGHGGAHGDDRRIYTIGRVRGQYMLVWGTDAMDTKSENEKYEYFETRKEAMQRAESIERRHEHGSEEARFPKQHEDDLVNNPEMLPNKISARYVRDLRSVIKKTKIEATYSKTTMPRGWRYGNVTHVSVGDRVFVFRLNVSDEEVSGIAYHLVTHDGGRQEENVVGQARASTIDPVITQLEQEVSSFYGPGSSRAGEPRFSWVKPPAEPPPGVGAPGEARELAHVERDPAVVSAGRQKGPITSPRDVYEFVHEDLDKRSQECFLVIPLDLHGQPLNPNPYLVAMGQRDRVSVDMSDVMRPVVESNAAGFVVVHGHPSGHCNPSQADKDLTKQIRETTETSFPSVAFIDHCVVGEASVHSIVEGKTYKMGSSEEESTPRAKPKKAAKRGRRRRAH